jgi:hypothetical protein
MAFLAVGIVMFCFCRYNDVTTIKEFLHVSGLWKVDNREWFKMGLNKKIARAEAEVARKHKPSQILPRKGLVIDSESGAVVRLKRTIEEELKMIPVMPFVSWGVYHMYRSAFPPELEIPNVKGDESYAGRLPAVQKLQDNQILIALRVPNPRRLDYSIPRWERLLKSNKAKNVGLYLMGDEFNYGSSFLNDFRNGSPCPFSFVIRDYFFDSLKNAEHTQIIQLGTMTCRKRKLACSVKPPDSVFVNMLPSAVKVEMRPTTFIKASERTRRCYWAGSDRNDRQEMAEYFQTSGGCDIYMTPGFNQGNNKTVYADILAASAFGLIPSGNSPETHRLAEVLMFGGVPAMLDRDAQAAHMLSYSEPIPLVSGRTWEEVDQRMRALSDDELNQLQQRVIGWWDRHWNCVQEDLRWIIAQAHAVSDGRDLCSLFETTVER